MLSGERLLRFAASFALISVAMLFPFSSKASIQLGAYLQYATSKQQVMDEYVAEVGRKPEILHNYRDLLLPFFYSKEAQTYRDYGVIPFITWEPYGPGGDNANTIPLSDIASGKYDSYINSGADQARNYGDLLYLRFAHEMNGSWYGWSSRTPGNMPSDYIAAWRRIVDIFRLRGATNVRFVWSPNIVQGSSSVSFAQYYPGTDYVDYLALDGYNWGSRTFRWQSLEEVFSRSIQELAKLGPQPMIIAETSSSEVGGSKADWIREGFLKTIPQRFPRVMAVLWFNMNKEDNWRFDSSPSSLAAYRDVANSTIYGGTIPPPPDVTGAEKVKATRLTIHVAGPGKVKVFYKATSKNAANRGGKRRLLCRRYCRIQPRSGTRVTAVAKPNKRAQFRGWKHTCQRHKKKCVVRVVTGDPVVAVARFRSAKARGYRDKKPDFVFLDAPGLWLR